MNKALAEWAFLDTPMRGNGKVSGLAAHLGVTQPAVTKMIYKDAPILVKHLKGIMEFTGISAKDLIPEHYELLKQSFELEMKNAIDNKKNEILDLLDQIKSDVDKISS